MAYKRQISIINEFSAAEEESTALINKSIYPK